MKAKPPYDMRHVLKFSWSNPYGIVWFLYNIDPKHLERGWFRWWWGFIVRFRYPLRLFTVCEMAHRRRLKADRQRAALLQPVREAWAALDAAVEKVHTQKGEVIVKLNLQVGEKEGPE